MLRPARLLTLLDRSDLEITSQVDCPTSITLAELQYGAAKSHFPKRNFRALAKFVALLEVPVFDSQAAAAYGPLREKLERQGTPIGSDGPINRCPRSGPWGCFSHQQRKRVPSCEGFASGKLGVITLPREPRPFPNLFLRDRIERPRGEQSPPGFQVTPQAAGRAD